MLPSASVASCLTSFHCKPVETGEEEDKDDVRDAVFLVGDCTADMGKAAAAMIIMVKPTPLQK